MTDELIEKIAEIVFRKEIDFIEQIAELCKAQPDLSKCACVFDKGVEVEKCKYHGDREKHLKAHYRELVIDAVKNLFDSEYETIKAIEEINKALG